MEFRNAIGIEAPRNSRLLTLPFWGVHLAALAGVLYFGWSWSGFALAVALYFARMFWITAGYHRYFSHRTFKTSRAFQLIMAIGGSTCMQKGALWWASRHRWHHKYSDMPEDTHSAKLHGFWWSHCAWFFGDDFTKKDLERLPDLARYRELYWLEKAHWVPGVLLAVILFATGGVHALLWGFFVSTTILWHGTFTINSLAHKIGKKRYVTTDESRNHWFLALITMGEGWHNNHHHYQSSTNQGFYWWEVDVTYYVLRLLSLFGVVWDIRTPPKHIVEERGKVALECGSAPLPTSSSVAPSSS
jgi:stearoyl-CoA desaturase (Delta-9 desaturase)